MNPNAAEPHLWRYTARYPRAAWVIDGRLSWPLLLLLIPLIPWSWKFSLIGGAIVLTGGLRYFAYPVPMARRRVRAFLRGWPRQPRRPARRFTQ